MHPQERRDQVRAAYVYQRLPLDAAAKACGIGYETARRWKYAAKASGDDWDKARAAGRLAAGGLGEITAQLLEDFALLFQSTVEQLKAATVDPLDRAEAISRLSDAYTKTMKAASTASPPLAELAVAMKVLEHLASFIREHHPQELPRFAAILEPFGARLAEVLG